MAEQLTILFRGDNKNLLGTLDENRAAVQRTATDIVAANNEIAQSAKLSGDIVFAQLTQFRIGLTQIARGDLGGIPNIIKGLQLAGAEAAEVAPQFATAQQSIKLLDGVFESLGAKLINGKVLFDEFQNSAKLAASGTSDEAKRLRREFEQLGIDASAAIAKPDKAFRDLLTTLARGGGQRQAANILNIGEGQVQAVARAGQAVAQLETAQTAAAASSQTLAAGLSTATLAAGAAALAIVGVVAGLGALAVGFANSANEAQRLADETGLTVDQVRLLQFAGSAANVEFSKIASTFTEFRDKAQKALNDTGEEADKVRRLFAILGVDATKAAKDPLTAYEDLIKKLADVRDSETRAAASKELLGARSEDLRRLFNLLAQDGGALREELQGLIGTVGDNNAAVNEYNIATTKLDAAWEGFKTTIGSSVLPVLTTLLTLITETAKRAELLADDIQDLFAELTGRGDENVTGGVDFDGSFDFGTGEEVRDKTKDVQAALKDRRRTTKQFVDNAAREDLRDLQNQLKTLDAEYQISNQRLKTRLDERLINEQQYTDKLKAIAAERERLALEILQAEENRVRNSRLSPTDQTRELQRIAQERADLERNTAVEIERIEADARIRERRAVEQFGREILQTQRIIGDQKIAIIEEQIEAQVLTAEEGQRRINTIVLALLQQQINAQAALANSFPTGSEQGQLELERLRQLEAEKIRIAEDGQRRLQQARARDIQARRQYLEDLRNIENETAQINLDALVANQQIRQVDFIRANAEIERRIIDETTAARIAALLRQLEANREFIALDEEQKAAQLENERRLTDLILAENERRIALLKASKDKENREVQRQNTTLGDALKNGADAVRQSSRAIIASFLTGQTTVRQAAQAFYDQLTAPLVDYLVDEGIAQSVLAARDLANLNFVGAALHGAAAAALFGGAALIGAGSRAIGGAPSISGGGVGSPALSPTNNQNAIATEDRYRFRESGALSPVTTIVIRHETGMFVEKVETALTQSYRNDGAAKKIVQNETTGRPF